MDVWDWVVITLVCVWLAILTTVANAQPITSATCEDVMRVESTENAQDDFAPLLRRELSGGALVFLWVSGSYARALVFEPRLNVPLPAKSPYHKAGTCTVDGLTVTVLKAELGGDKA